MTELIAKLGIDWKLLLANTTTFFIILWLLRKYAYRPILGALDKRQKTINDGLDAAKTATVELEKLRQDREQILKAAKLEAHGIVATATRDAAAVRKETMTATQAESAALLAKTKLEMGRAKVKMLDDAKADLADIVVAATGQVLGKTMDGAANKKLADQALAEVQRTHS